MLGRTQTSYGCYFDLYVRGLANPTMPWPGNRVIHFTLCYTDWSATPDCAVRLTNHLANTARAWIATHGLPVYRFRREVAGFWETMCLAPNTPGRAVSDELRRAALSFFCTNGSSDIELAPPRFHACI